MLSVDFGSKMISRILRMFLIALFIFNILSLPEGFAAFTILSSQSTNNVEIDGKWTNSLEWKNASEFSIKRNMQTFGYILFKDDAKFLYILIDYTSDISANKNDSAILRFDTNITKEITQMTGCPIGGCSGYLPGPSPQSDDYVIIIKWGITSFTQTFYNGNGIDWSLCEELPIQIEAKSTKNSENDPYSKNSHIIYEFAISRELFGNKSEIGVSVLAINVAEGNNEKTHMTLPSYSHHLKPYTWAILSFATEYERNSINTTTTQSHFQPTKENFTTTHSITPIPETVPILKSEESPKVKEEGIFKVSSDYYLIGIVTVFFIILLMVFNFENKKVFQKDNEYFR